MKAALVPALLLSLFLPASAQVKRVERKSLIDRDPDVVHLAEHVQKPIELRVLKEAPVFSDKNGKNRLGTLKADQTVVLEGHGEAVGGRPGEAGARHESGQGGRPGLQRCEHERGLVEYADARSVVHMPILSSQGVGCKM